MEKVRVLHIIVAGIVLVGGCSSNDDDGEGSGIGASGGYYESTGGTSGSGGDASVGEAGGSDTTATDAGYDGGDAVSESTYRCSAEECADRVRAVMQYRFETCGEDPGETFEDYAVMVVGAFCQDGQWITGCRECTDQLIGGWDCTEATRIVDAMADGEANDCMGH